MFKSSFDMERITDLLDSLAIRELEPIGPYKMSVLRATGMALDELNVFLEAKGFHHSCLHISARAISELEEWYVGKMRRYVRNVIALELKAGSDEDLLFREFCARYHKSGHHDVKSWEDIDEIKLRLDFEEECYELYFPILPIKNNDGLLGRIHRSCIFHLRLKKNTTHGFHRDTSIISIILCNRYHIFTSEADALADTTNTRAIWLIKKWLYPPRHEIPYGLAS